MRVGNLLDGRRGRMRAVYQGAKRRERQLRK